MHHTILIVTFPDGVRVKEHFHASPAIIEAAARWWMRQGAARVVTRPIPAPASPLQRLLAVCIE